MIETRPVRGIVPVVSTPLTKEEDIDIPGLKRLVEFLIDKKIGGLWVLGTGSEDMNLTFSKRLQVARTICEVNAGKIPLMLGAGFFAMEDILNFIRETEGLEFDAYHVMPYHPLLSLDRLDWFYRHIADNCPRPLWIYTSANWSRPITPEFVSGLKEHPNICGIKFSTRDSVAITKVARLADDKFQVITAVASQLYACLCMGSRAHTSSLGSCLPEILIRIYELFTEGKYDKALSEQHRLNDFLAAFSRNTKTDNFLAEHTAAA
ncbi:MAG: dihydrodipicolinate synthase family protein [Deltaproteobacteria bacterium]|nr:dihydrodipicolinate synthase family protein [Deltaproteobacteria bacterium]